MGVFQGEFCASFKEKIWIYMQLYAEVHIIAYKMPGWGIKWHKVLLVCFPDLQSRENCV